MNKSKENCEAKTIDWELGLKLANNKPELAKELLALLIAELPQARASIDLAYKEKNYRQLHQQVHKLHGASCYCGVPKLRKIASSLESELKSSNKPAIKKLLKNLFDEIDEILLTSKYDNYLSS